MAKPTHKTLRQALRAKYGRGRYRITGTSLCEVVDVYGVAPNSQTLCWWRLGFIEHVYLMLDIERGAE